MEAATAITCSQRGERKGHDKIEEQRAAHHALDRGRGRGCGQGRHDEYPEH
jgi:hypothetical protein